MIDPSNPMQAMFLASLLNSVIIHDKHDSRVFQETAELHEGTQELLSNPFPIPELDKLLEEVFCSFYKPAPQLTPEEKLSLSAQARRRMLEEMMQTNEYHQVRGAGTAQNQFVSILATAAVVYRILEKLDYKTKKQ